jgi:hypothetical protein
MVVSDADDDWIDNTMLDDAIEETAAPGPSNGTLYIPEFVTECVHDGMTEEEMLAAHALFLKKRSPGLIAEIHRPFPQNKDICADTGQRSME